METTAGRVIDFNWARFDVETDVQSVVQQTAAMMADEIDQWRRGVVSDNVTMLRASELDAFEAMRARRPGAPLGDAATIALRTLWAAASRKLREVAQAASAHPSPQNLFAFRRMMAIQHAIQLEALAARAEAARSLRAWRLQVGGGDAETAELLGDLIAQAGGYDANLSLARRVAALGVDDANVQRRVVDGTALARTAAAIEEWWVNSLLWSAQTHNANIIGNAGVIAYTIAERGAISRAARFVGRPQAMEVGEAAAFWIGLRGGLPDALRYMGRSFRTGETGFGMSKVEAAREMATQKAMRAMGAPEWLALSVGTVATIPGRSLTAADEFFKTLNYSAELNAGAFRTAAGEVRAGELAEEAIAGRMAEILEQARSNDPRWSGLRLRAREAAEVNTFTKPPGEFDHLTRAAMALANVPVIGRLVLPFINTPANIMRYALNRSPLAPLVGEYRRAIEAGGDAAFVANARVGFGAMISFLGVDLAMQGTITGSGPADPNQRRALRRMGWRPYAIRIGDRYWTFSRLDPFGLWLGMSADLSEIIMNGAEDVGDMQIMEAMWSMAFAIGGNLFSKTYMDGVSGFIEALAHPDSTYLTEGFGNDVLAAFLVPNVAPPIRRQIDPIMRSTHDLISEIKNRLPVFSKDLPPFRDRWGRPIKYSSGINWVYDLLSPIYSSKFDPEPIDEAIVRDQLSIGMPNRSLYVGRNMSLRNRPELYSRFLELAGTIRLKEGPARDENGELITDSRGRPLANVVDDEGQTLLERLNALVEGRLGALSEAYEAAEPGPGATREAIVRSIIAGYDERARQILRAQLVEEDDPIITRAAELVARRQGGDPAHMREVFRGRFAFEPGRERVLDRGIAGFFEPEFVQ